jgi:hypothetical protein
LGHPELSLSLAGGCGPRTESPAHLQSSG